VQGWSQSQRGDMGRRRAYHCDTDQERHHDGLRRWNLLSQNQGSEPTRRHVAVVDTRQDVGSHTGGASLVPHLLEKLVAEQVAAAPTITG